MNQIILFIWILQVILESLPISSSSHIYLMGRFSKKYLNRSLPEIPEYLEHLMHAPTAIVLSVFLYLLYTVKGVFAGQLGTVFLYILLADVITTLFYFLFKKYRVSKQFMPIGFLITALAFLSLYFITDVATELRLIHAVVVGAVQGLALLPGISRLGITFVVGCWLGLAPLESIAFSCAIELPLICGALAKSMFAIVAHRAPPIVLTASNIILLTCASVIAFFCLVLVSVGSLSFAIAHLGWYLLLVAALSA